MQYLTYRAEGLARCLQGLFALLIVNQRTRLAHVITDRCGSLHVYWRQLADGVAVCTSSAVLAQFAPSTLDLAGVQQRRYWDFTAVEPERLNREEVAEQTHHGLSTVLISLANAEKLAKGFMLGSPLVYTYLNYE